MTDLPIGLIAALDTQGGIGRDGRLPWRLPADLKQFKAATLGRPVIVGRRTWQSLPGRRLPGRELIVLSNSARPTATADGITFARDLTTALARAQNLGGELGADRIWIAGGAQIYAQTLALADQLRLSRVRVDAHCDTFFPAFQEHAWPLRSRTHHPAGPDTPAWDLDIRTRA